MRSRTLHGALLDAELLVEVYLAMTRGTGIADDRHGRARPCGTFGAGGRGPAGHAASGDRDRARADEAALHDEYLAALDRESSGHCVWLVEPAAAASEPMAVAAA